MLQYGCDGVGSACASGGLERNHGKRDTLNWQRRDAAAALPTARHVLPTLAAAEKRRGIVDTPSRFGRATVAPLDVLSLAVTAWGVWRTSRGFLC